MTGPSGNGINPGFTRQQHWMAHLKENCHYCHQQGTPPTRVNRSLEELDETLRSVKTLSDALHNSAQLLPVAEQQDPIPEAKR